MVVERFRDFVGNANRIRDAPTPYNLTGFLSAFRGRGTAHKGGDEETGKLPPPQSVIALRLSSMVIKMHLR